MTIYHRHSNHDLADQKEIADAAAFARFDHCLGCNARANACPLQVDIPEMRSHLLHIYRTARCRPLADQAALLMEPFAPLIRLLRTVAGSVVNISLALAARFLGHLPRLSMDCPEKASYRVLRAGWIARMVWPQKSGRLVQDTFISLFDTEALAVAEALSALCYRPHVVSAAGIVHARGQLPHFSRWRSCVAGPRN